MAFMTNEERKQPFNWEHNFFRFETCVDLSQGVKIRAKYPNFKGDEKDMELYSIDFACFMAYYMREIYPRLNGFSGFDTIKWKFEK